MKSIACHDLFPGCNFRAEAETEAELLRKAADHAARDHGITQMTDDIIAKVKGCIRTS